MMKVKINLIKLALELKKEIEKLRNGKIFLM